MKQTFLSILALFCCAITAQAQPSSFSRSNTHITMPQGYNDFSLKNSGVVGSSNFGTYIDLGGGNWFKGSTSNGRPSRGTLHLSNGVEHKGAFNANIQPTGVVLTTWPDGTWYYGNYVNGVRHGSGSMYLDGAYYDVVMSNNETESAVEVDTPRYNKADFDGQVNAANNAYGESYSGSSSGSTRAKTHGQKRCSLCDGTGKCSRCNGKGYYVAIGIGSGTHRCTSCGQTGKCSSCNGKGTKYGILP